MVSTRNLLLRSASGLIVGLSLLSLTLAAGIPMPAHASSAQLCADKLSPEAKTIYVAAAPRVTPKTDLVSLLKSTVPGLIFEGNVRAATARESARAAYPCLKALK